MPVTVGHVLTATTPDDPAYEIRPSHWNSNHAVTFAPTGAEIIGAFSNENNVSFSTNGAGFVVASANVTAAPSPVNVTGANGSSVNAQTLAFNNANGMTLGVSTAANGATVTGSYTVPTVPTAYVSSVNGSSGAISLNVGSSLSSSTNGSSITFGLASNITTALQPAGNYLTTARASNDAIGLNTALTAGPLAWTVNSSGLSLNAASAAGTTSGFTGNLISGSMTHNTAGLALSLNHPSWLTTARASNDAIGLNTAQTNVTWTVNSSGLSLNAGGYAGTGTSISGAASITLNSNGLQFNGNGLAGTATGFTGANISGSMTHNTAGLSLSLSVAAGGGVNPVASASNGSFSFTTLNFSNANNVTFGTSAGSIITASVAPPGAAAENNAINLLGANTAGNTTATGSTIGWSGVNLTLSGTNNSQIVVSAPATSSLVAGGDISISTNGSTITISRTVGQASYWNPFEDPTTTASQIGNGSVFVQPMFALRGAISLSRFNVFGSMSISSSSNSSHAGALSFQVGIYTRNGSTLSLASSGSQSYQWTNTSNNSQASLSALRMFSVPVNVNITGDGDYWVAVHSRSSTTNANWFTASNVRITQFTTPYQGLIGEASNATRQLNIGYGLWSTTSTALPNSIAFSEIRGIGTGVANNAIPVFMNANNFSA